MRTLNLLPLSGLLICLSPLAQAQVDFLFCYEDKQLPPYYRGVGDTVPADSPGASIEHLQQLVQQVGQVQLKFQRLPWKRCLSQLEEGAVDAVIASYRPEREQIGQYPFKQGQPDSSRAFNEHQTCLVKRPQDTWTFDGKEVRGIDTLVVGRPLGYAPVLVTGPKQVLMHYTLSGTMDLDLLKAGRLNAVTTLCSIAGKPAVSATILAHGLQVVQPPLYGNTGYLLFSKQFYQRHPAIAEALWQQLKSYKAEALYHRYMEMNFLAGTTAAVSAPAPANKTQ